MKKLYALVFIVFHAPAFAQVVNIPDVNFKNKLLSATALNNVATNNLGSPVMIDLNGDGEIQQSEALIIKSLNLDSSGIESLEGIAAFANLEFLQCSANNLSALDLSALLQLKSLDCSVNQLTTLTLNSQLQTLVCNGNHLSTLDLSNMTQLIAVDCYENLLTSINLQNSPMISWLFCYGNQLSQIDLSGLTNLNTLSLADNQLTSLTIPKIAHSEDSIVDIGVNPLTSVTFSDQVSFVKSFYCNSTQLTDLDLSTIELGNEISIVDNPLLQHINFKNGNRQYCYGSWVDCSMFYFILYNNPQLQSVCVDNQSEANYIIDLLNNPAVNVSSYCSYTPGGNYNTVTGSVHFDHNANGCDAGDATAGAVPVRLAIGNNYVGSLFANNNGSYTGYLTNQNVSLTPQFENPYFTVTPASVTPVFSGWGNTQTVDFCIAPNGVHPDLDITLLPVTPARPGFDAIYKIIFKNKGNLTLSGNIALDFNDGFLDFVSANPAVNAQSFGTLNWNFANLVPFESRNITFTMNANSPQESPAVNIGETLAFTAAISAAGTDETPNDNIIDFNQIVVGSYDPNDKTVTEGSSVDITKVDNYLHYIIRFQNSGNAAAQNIVVTDQLAANLDRSTLQLLSASHPFRSSLNWDNNLEFVFEDINLPPASENEAGSNGYVSFKIKPMQNVGIGSVIENSAKIYFDFNFPIVTNTTSTTYTALATTAFEKNTFTLHPNPATSTITLSAPSKIKVSGIYNVLGQLIKTNSTETGKDLIIDISNLKSGTYLIKAVSDQGTSTQKFIKL